MQGGLIRHIITFSISPYQTGSSACRCFAAAQPVCIFSDSLETASRKSLGSPAQVKSVPPSPASARHTQEPPFFFPVNRAPLPFNGTFPAPRRIKTPRDIPAPLRHGRSAAAQRPPHIWRPAAMSCSCPSNTVCKNSGIFGERTADCSSRSRAGLRLKRSSLHSFSSFMAFSLAAHGLNRSAMRIHSSNHASLLQTPGRFPP